MEVILYSKECNWYTRCCPLNGGVRYRECPLREAILNSNHKFQYLITEISQYIFQYIDCSFLKLAVPCNLQKDVVKEYTRVAVVT